MTPGCIIFIIIVKGEAKMYKCIFDYFSLFVVLHFNPHSSVVVARNIYGILLDSQRQVFLLFLFKRYLKLRPYLQLSFL